MIIAVASGKGGTGKTTVAVNLALSLKDRSPVCFLDCDVEEPNAYVFLKPEIKSRETVFPELCHGCGGCERLCPEQAIVEKGQRIGRIDSGFADDIRFYQGQLDIGQAMSPPVIRVLKKKVPSKGTVIIDVPPGTSCAVVESIKGSDFCLLVTEPTPFGLNDLRLAVKTLRKMRIPTGVVNNRASSDTSKVQRYCDEERLPILMTIPMDRDIAVAYSTGKTIVETQPAYRKDFQQVFEQIRRLAL